MIKKRDQNILILTRKLFESDTAVMLSNPVIEKVAIHEPFIQSKLSIASSGSKSENTSTEIQDELNRD